MFTAIFQRILPVWNVCTLPMFVVSLCSGGAVAFGEDLPAPIAHWKLDDQGSEARDSVGKHHGVIHGAVSREGKIGAALLFDRAKGNHVSIPHSSDFEVGSFTVSAWVWLTKEPTFSGILGTRAGGEFNFDMKVNTDKVHGDIGDGTKLLGAYPQSPAWRQL